MLEALNKKSLTNIVRILRNYSREQEVVEIDSEEEKGDNLKIPHLRLSRTSKQSTMVDGWKAGTALGGEASAYT